MVFQKFISKLNNKHFLSLSGNGAMAVLAMLTVSVLLRYMPANDIGYWFFFQTIFVLLDTFRTGFLQIALIKFYSGTEKKRAATVLGSVWYLALCITGLLIVVDSLAFMGLHFISNQGIITTIQWFGITFICTLPAGVASWILQADQRFDRLLVLRIINQGIFFIMIITLIIVKDINLGTILLLNALSAATASLFCFIKGWTRINTIRRRSMSCIREIFHYGKYSVGTTISSNLLRSSDTFIIMFLLGAAGPAAVAMYTIPARLMEIIEIPLRSFLATGMPAMSEAFNKNKKEEVVYLMKKYAGMLTLALIPVCITAIIFADFAIGLLGGVKYMGTDAVSAFRIFMSFAIIFPIERFMGVTLDIIHQPKINFLKVLIMLATNIVLDVAGIYLFGSIDGVALASLFTFIVGSFFGYYWLNKYLDFTIAGILETGFTELKLLIQQIFHKKDVIRN